MKFSTTTEKYFVYIFCCLFGAACTFAYFFLASGTYSNVSKESEVNNGEENLARDSNELIGNFYVKRDKEKNNQGYYYLGYLKTQSATTSISRDEMNKLIGSSKKLKGYYESEDNYFWVIPVYHEKYYKPGEYISERQGNADEEGYTDTWYEYEIYAMEQLDGESNYNAGSYHNKDVYTKIYTLPPSIYRSFGVIKSNIYDGGDLILFIDNRWPACCSGDVDEGPLYLHYSRKNKKTVVSEIDFKINDNLVVPAK